jgi:hypothetical protein
VVPAALTAMATLLAACGTAAPLDAPQVEPPPVPRVVPVSPETPEPSGELVVAVPAEPTAWIVPEGDDLAALDLAAVWGLPLYRVGPAGQVVGALAVDEQVSADGRSITIELAEGRWSDDVPVTADDVVATVEALRGTGLGHELDVVAAVEADGPTRVRFSLHHPSVRWQVLLGTTGVLPAHVLAEGGLAAAAALEVTGGPFRLVDHDPGLGATFAAHAGSALGAPALEALHVRYVPSYDVALGLLDEGRVDVAVGYLAVGAVRRAERLGLEAAAPVGGTWVALRWGEGGEVSSSQRQAVASIVDVTDQVEGLGLGEELEVPILTGAPRVTLPQGRADPAEVASVDATLVVRGDVEALALTGRLLEAQVRAWEGRLQLRRERTPDDVAVTRDADAALVVRRDPPRPDLTRDLRETLREAARLADAWPSTSDAAVVEVLESGLAEAWSVPLYRPPVAHVWHPDVVGLVPSAWPGTGLASVARWHLDEAS